MLVKSRIFENYDSYDFKIPLHGGETIYVKKSQRVNDSTKIYASSENSITESFYLVEELGCSPEDCIKTVNCVDGEYIDKGDNLASYTKRDGLTRKVVISNCSGIVDLSRIEKGFIDILGEESSVVFESNFSGVVKDVMPGSNITITSPATALDISATTIFDEKIFGQLHILDDGKTIPSGVDKKLDLKGKVVWAGPYLSIYLAYKLFQRGASALLTYAMEYEEFRKLGLPVGVVEGFGKVHCDEYFVKEFLKFNNHFVVLDGDEKQLFVAKDHQDGNVDSTYFVEGLLGSKVISRHFAHYGHIGIVTQVHDIDLVTVEFSNTGSAMVDIGSLDFINS